MMSNFYPVYAAQFSCWSIAHAGGTDATGSAAVVARQSVRVDIVRHQREPQTTWISRSTPDKRSIAFDC